MGKQGQPRPPRDNGPDTDMRADGLWLARPGSANDRRLTQSVANPVPVANLTEGEGRRTLTHQISSECVHYLGFRWPKTTLWTIFDIWETPV